MDLQTLFSAVCNMTITATVVIGCVLLARLALRNAPRGFACALWLVVLFRLLCPVAPSAPVSVLSVVDAPKAEAPISTVTYVPSPVQAPVETIHVTQEMLVEVAPVQPAEPSMDWHRFASRVWAAGMTLLIAYGIVSYVNLKRKLRESVPIGPGLREADGIRSPFLLGLLRPVIYLPSGLRPEERGHILLHEQCHLRHGDHLVKAAFWLAVCIHWFNPLAWLAFILCGRDMEMRCDEAVLKSLGPQVRSDYAQALLNFATGRRMAPAPLAFGEGDTGKRVKHVLSWKQKAAWALIPAAILCAVVLVITAVNPGGKTPDSPFGHSYKATTVVPTRYDTPVEQEQLYTLTSDMALFVRSGQNTFQEGSFKKLNRLPADCAAFESAAEWALMKTEVDNAWEAIQPGGDNYLLLQTEDGALYLIQGETRYHLERADLLDVTILQLGEEVLIEPVWYRYEEEDWLLEDLPGAQVNSAAQIILSTEKDLETITVEETYFQATEPGLYGGIRVMEYVLHRDVNGEFILTVRRRGTFGEDNAVYRVTVGEDHYKFRLTFPDAPAPTEPTHAVTFTHDNAFITLRIPESWGSSTISPEDEEYDASMTGGISFWPKGREEGKIFFGYYPDLFAVCGTGLENTAMSLAGQTATVGTYDDHEVWDFICFSDHFAVWGQGHEAWWAEYGEQAMAILDSAVFGEDRIDLTDLPEGDIICELPDSPTEP